MASETAWSTTRLGDVAQVRHGWAFKSEFFSSDLTGQPIVVNIGNFAYSGGFRFGETAVREYRGTYPPEFELAPGDVLVVMTCQTAGGEILGIPGRIPHDGRTYLHNQRMGKVDVTRPDLVHDRWLYWVFLTPRLNSWLASSASGTKILHTSPGRIAEFKLALPPLRVQQADAAVLDALQDKIDLNRRMNSTLESIAQALFRSWFIDFDPVCAKAEGREPSGMDAETAALFPSNLEDTGFGDIPFGWQAEALTRFTDVLSGGTPKTGVEAYWSGDVPWVSVADTMPGPFITVTAKSVSEAGIANSATQVLPARTLVLSARGTVGNCALMAGAMAMNQSCYGLRGRDGVGQIYLLHLVREQVGRLRASAHGSVFDTITRSTLDSLSVIRPPNDLIRKYEQDVEPLFELILANAHSSRSLIETRDYLLPKLLSGEIRVAEAERLAEVAT